MPILKQTTYPSVADAHVVPRVYLKQFAVDGLIDSLDPTGRRVPRRRSTRKAGTRPYFYRRIRPKTGKPIDDVEASLAALEAKAAWLIRWISDAWPLTQEDKVRLGSFCSALWVRTPAWSEWHAAFTKQVFEGHRVEAALEGRLDSRTLLSLNATEQVLLDDTSRLTRMLSLAQKTVTLYASMSWALLEAEGDFFVTSDQPLVVWPIGVHRREPQANTYASGIVESLEVRLPLSPRHALLLTWSTARGHDGLRIQVGRDIAANFNAFTVANADTEWFRKPGSSPPVAHGQLEAVAPALLAGYSFVAARDSILRHRVNEVLQSKVGVDDLSAEEIELVTVTHSARMAGSP